MTKNEMKTNAVVIRIIIMLDFTQVVYNPSFVQNGTNSSPSKIDYYHKC